ncbi:type ISP restriction/modification enzyme [Flavobacterium sp. WC2509]|uniref:type ISP restriction/modification enzyme n=1 Tax=Flavobacterium sp. WC2509 TaxID=3461406 RepID=UPI0040448913
MKPIPFNIFLETAEKFSLLNKEMAQKIAGSLGLLFINQQEAEENVCFANSNDVRPEFKESFTQQDLLKYNYAVFHSSTYREKYEEFQKTDSLNIPIQTDRIKFWKLVQLGDELRKIHLLENDTIEQNKIQYLEDGDIIVKEIDTIII